MGIFNRITSADEIEDLSVKLALLYIEKSDKRISSPRDIAREFVEAQSVIEDALKNYR